MRPKSANDEHPRHVCVGGPPGKQITICSTWFFVRSMVTVSREYWLCFTQFRFGWMTGFMVRSNGVLLTFVYFYQLGETALSSALHFLTFTEVARAPHFLKKKEKKRNIHFQVKGIFHRIRIFDWQTSPKHPNLWLVRFDPILYRDPQNDYLYKTQGHPGTIFCKITVRRSNIAKKFLKLEKS